MKVREGCIYMITSPSGRVYIGQTTNLVNRLSRYRTGHCKSQKLLNRSFTKYGFYSHVIKTLETCVETELDSLEISWIDKLKVNKCRYPEGCGLNMTDGGKTVRGIKRSLQHKLAISIGNTGRKHTLESIERTRLVNIGRKDSTETKMKKVAKLIGHLVSVDTRAKIAYSQGKLILDFTTGIYYECSKDASRALNMKDVTLRSWLRGDRPNKSQLKYV